MDLDAIKAKTDSIKQNYQGDEETLNSNTFKDFREVYNYVLKTCENPTTDTIYVEYKKELSTILVQVKQSNDMLGTKIVVNQVMCSSDNYLQFLHQLGIDENRPYCDSQSIHLRSGCNIRIYATNKPFREFPMLVISSQRPPETFVPQSQKQGQLMNMLLHGRTLICGKSGSGKTYLLDSLLKTYIEQNCVCGIFEEFSELHLPNNVSFKYTIPCVNTSQTQFNDLNFLLEKSNLQRLDYIICGELKGVESLSFIKNLSTGTKGVATIHGIDPQEALVRLKMQCLMSGDNLSADLVSQTISRAVDYVMYVEKREIKSICKVILSARGNFSFQILYGEDFTRRKN